MASPLLARLAAALLAAAALGAAARACGFVSASGEAVGHTRVRPRPSGRATALRAASEGEAPAKTYRQAHLEAQLYESHLKAVRGNASALVRELDALFAEKLEPGRAELPQKAPPKEEEKKDVVDQAAADLFGFGKAAADPTPLFPDLKKNPPVLAGKYAAGAPIIGAFASDPYLMMPGRRYPAEFIAGASADPAASDEENELWKESVSLLVEGMDELYLETEERVVAVERAERAADTRRGDEVGKFRNRVIQQMIYATDGIYDPDKLSEWLEVLQTDSRMDKYLALLEKTALEAEELQEEIRAAQREAQDNPEGSPEQDRAVGRARGAAQRAFGLDVRIRSCVRAAEEMPETMDAYETLGEEWDKINPFKMFR